MTLPSNGKGTSKKNGVSGDNKGGNNVMSSNQQGGKGNADYAKARLLNKRAISTASAHPIIATIASAAIDTWHGKLTINAAFDNGELATIQAAIDSMLPIEQKKIDPILFGDRPMGISSEVWHKYIREYFNDMARGSLPVRNGVYYKAIPIRPNQYVWFVKTGDIIRALEYAGCFGTLKAKDAEDITASAAYAVRMSATRMSAPLAMDVYNMGHDAIKKNRSAIKATDKHADLVSLRSAAIKANGAKGLTASEHAALRDQIAALDADCSKADGRKTRAWEAYRASERLFIDAWTRSQGVTSAAVDASAAIAAVNGDVVDVAPVVAVDALPVVA